VLLLLRVNDEYKKHVNLLIGNPIGAAVIEKAQRMVCDHAPLAYLFS